MRKFVSVIVLLCALLFSAQLFSVWAAEIRTGLGALKIDTMLGGLEEPLNEPWAVDFLPNGGFLVTERGGALIYSKDGKSHKVQNLPAVQAIGQGGLLDVAVAKDFAVSREIFLSFARETSAGVHTAVVRARLSRNYRRLENRRVIFQAKPIGRGGRHFGGRITQAQDGTLFITIGERANRKSAQDLSNHNGTVVRINRDGSVPADNPFVGEVGGLGEGREEIWSYGHRNAQGAALDSFGDLWIADHGARGGDEVNRIIKGANYGWPVISYGRHYSGFKIGEGTHKPGMQQPEFYWDPSMAPSGMMIYSGKLWSAWRGHIFVGSLKFDYIARLAGAPLDEAEQIRAPQTARVRDIAEAPDGSIWFISVAHGAVYRISRQ